jgi:hypothetical protein
MIGQALGLYLLFPLQPHQLAVLGHANLDTVLLQHARLVHHKAGLAGQQERARELRDAQETIAILLVAANTVGARLPPEAVTNRCTGGPPRHPDNVLLA